MIVCTKVQYDTFLEAKEILNSVNSYAVNNTNQPNVA